MCYSFAKDACHCSVCGVGSIQRCPNDGSTSFSHFAIQHPGKLLCLREVPILCCAKTLGGLGTWRHCPVRPNRVSEAEQISAPQFRAISPPRRNISIPLRAKNNKKYMWRHFMRAGQGQNPAHPATWRCVGSGEFVGQEGSSERPTSELGPCFRSKSCLGVCEKKTIAPQKNSNKKL